MSRKSQSSQRLSGQNSRHILSQKASSSQESLNSDEEINSNLNEQVNDLVRYFVIRAGEHTFLKRSEIKKNVLRNAGANFQRIVDEATKVLKNVYGYNLIIEDAPQSSSKGYMISNALSYIDDPTEPQQDEYPEDVDNVFLLLILTHIFMTNNAVSEASLFAFLRSLRIDIDRRHELFGNIKDCINNFQKKKYIGIEIDPLSKKALYNWGPRAEKEISKKKVLKFVCKIYKDRLPVFWVNQNKAANEQNLGNDEEIPMETD